jgi:hypothetical protein
MRTARRHPLNAKSVFIDAPDLLALISTRGYHQAKGRAELDTERPAQEGERGYIDAQTYLAVLAQELLKCRSELAQLKKELSSLSRAP